MWKFGHVDKIDKVLLRVVPIQFQDMHCMCCAKNFEIKMCFNQTITIKVLPEEVTSLPKDKC